MPQIIGKNPNREVDCTNCGTKMSFRRDEVRAGKRILGSDDTDHESVITCPVCHTQIHVTHLVGGTSTEQAQKEADDDLY